MAKRKKIPDIAPHCDKHETFMHRHEGIWICMKCREEAAIDYDQVCDCVIVHTNSREQWQIDNYKIDGDRRKEIIRSIFMDGRPHIADADCKVCRGTGRKP